MTEGYAANGDHLRDELSWLDQVLRLGLLRSRVSGRRWGGLVVTDEAVQSMLARRSTEPAPPRSDEERSLREAVRATREEIARRVEITRSGSTDLRLVRLSRVFGLSPFETDVLVLALAPEMDLKYERIYSYLEDDATRRLPTVDLVFHLLCETPQERAKARGAFLSSAPLFRYPLIETPDGADSGRSLLGRSIRVDEGVAHYLLGSRVIDPRIARIARLIPAPEGPPAATPAGEAEQRLLAALREYLGSDDRRQWIAILQGQDRLGQERTVRALCEAADLPILRVDLESIGEDPAFFERSIRLSFREAAVRGAAVHLERADLLQGDTAKDLSRSRCLAATLSDMGAVTFLSGEKPWEPPDFLKSHFVFSIDYPVPSYPERRALWEKTLNGTYRVAPDVDLAGIAASFRFTPGEIQNATHTARNAALLREGAGFTLTRADLLGACRSESSHALLSFGRKVVHRHAWEDLVLPEAQKTQLREVLDHVRHHESVMSEWGFRRKHTLGQGVNMLFSGPSGTGKTMAASILAGGLGLDLYKIDLSTVVSKFIGETEKNLSRVFREAETSNAILFFDEADALFGKRSEVRDSHDRYANIEVNYLLQKMEEHEGIVVLASNLSKNLDDAFVRRLQFTVVFPFPERDERLEIWKRVFPAEAPLGPDVDVDFLSRRLKIAGGSIKNIALSAAFLAQSARSAIGMREIILSTKREFQKMGKICVKADFGEFYELVS